MPGNFRILMWVGLLWLSFDSNRYRFFALSLKLYFSHLLDMKSKFVMELMQASEASAPSSRRNPLFEQCQLLHHVLVWFCPLHPFSRVPAWPPLHLPVIRSLLRFREQQTSETVWTFPVEWSQRPHDFNKWWQTCAGAHISNITWQRRKTSHPVEPCKRSLQVFGVFVFMCRCVPCALLIRHACITSVLSSFSDDLCHVIVLTMSRYTACTN